MAKILILQDQLPDAASMLIRKDLQDSINEFLNWVLHLGGECENQISSMLSLQSPGKTKLESHFRSETFIYFNNNY